MLYKKSLGTLLAALVLFASQAASQQVSTRPRAVEAERLRAHVTYLASDKLEGRRTGTPGAQEAARYVAEEFMRAGVLPGAVVGQSGTLYPELAGPQISPPVLPDVTLIAPGVDGPKVSL